MRYFERTPIQLGQSNVLHELKPLVLLSMSFPPPTLLGITFARKPCITNNCFPQVFELDYPFPTPRETPLQKPPITGNSLPQGFQLEYPSPFPGDTLLQKPPLTWNSTSIFSSQYPTLPLSTSNFGT